MTGKRDDRRLRGTNDGFWSHLGCLFSAVHMPFNAKVLNTHVKHRHILLNEKMSLKMLV